MHFDTVGEKTGRKKNIVISFVVILITFGNSGTILPLLEIGLNLFVEGREIQNAAVLYVL